jgi:hypothetical protein
MRPSGRVMSKSSIVPPCRSFRYSVCPLSRWPDPGMMLAVVMPPACARLMPVDRTLTESRTRTSGWIGAEESAPAGLAM